MSNTLAPLLQQPSAPGTRQWFSFNPTNFNLYVFVVGQVRDAAGNWSGYAAGWSNGALWWQTQIYGSRPAAPSVVPGSPFAQYSDMVAACQTVLDGLA